MGDLVVPAGRLGCGCDSVVFLGPFDVEFTLLVGSFTVLWLPPTVPRHRHKANWEPIQGVTLPLPQDSWDSLQHPCDAT